MRLSALGGRRQRLLLWLARLALFAYAFQLTAVDHWHKDVNSVVGDEGKSSHSYHCHGDVSKCAEQGGIVSSLVEVQLAPIPPSLLTTLVVVTLPAPRAAFVSSADEPPQYFLRATV
jgi:hypothetical protein